jgi:hypothetical protein
MIAYNRQSLDNRDILQQAKEVLAAGSSLRRNTIA